MPNQNLALSQAKIFVYDVKNQTGWYSMSAGQSAGETGCSIIIATAANKDSAKKIARLLVEKRLAACAQMFPIESVYLWQGEICEDSETALLIKSKTALFGEIKAAIKEAHSYEVPEIIQIPITNGLPEYLKWIGDSATAYSAMACSAPAAAQK